MDKIQYFVQIQLTLNKKYNIPTMGLITDAGCMNQDLKDFEKGAQLDCPEPQQGGRREGRSQAHNELSGQPGCGGP